MKKGISIFLCLLLLLVMLVGCGENTRTMGDITFTYNSGWHSEYFPIESEAYPNEYFKCSPKSNRDITVYAYHLSDSLDDGEKEDLRKEKVEDYIIGMVDSSYNTLDDGEKKAWRKEKVEEHLHGIADSAYDTLILYEASEEEDRGLVQGLSIKRGSVTVRNDVVGRYIDVASFIYKDAIYLVTFEMYGDDMVEYFDERENYLKLLKSIELK